MHCVECKDGPLEDELERAKLRAAARLLACHGIGFHLFVPDLSPHNAFTRNAQALLDGRRVPLSPHERAWLRQWLHDGRECACGESPTLGQLCEAIGQTRALAALARGLVHADFNHPLRRATALHSHLEEHFDASFALYTSPGDHPL